MTLSILRAPQFAPADPTPVTGVPGGLPDDRLSVVVAHPDGTTTLWGPDEVDAGNVPIDLSFQTSMPGGFTGLACNLLRDIRVSDREGVFDGVQVLGAGGEVRWEGRLQQVPGSTDQGGRVSPQVVGWSAHLEDDATAREIYVDRDLGSWGGRPLMRTYSLISSGRFKASDAATGSASSEGTSPGPSIDLNVPGYPWTANDGRPDIGLTYQGGGIELGGVEYRWFNPLLLSFGWNQLLEGFTNADGDNAIGSVMTTGNNVTSGGRVSATMPAGVRRADVSLRYVSAPAGDANSTWGVQLVEPAVYGRHGLPGVRGRSYLGAGQGPLGFLASDIVADAVRRWAPLLRTTTGPGGSITPTDFPIPHLVFREHTTAAEIVERCNAYHVWDWAVWEDRTLHFAPRGANGRTWTIATADGLDLSLEGDTTDRIYNGVVVTYTDYAGVTRSVGPTGARAEASDDRLVSQDPSNPATAHGLRRWGVLPLSVPSDVESAVAIGQAWLMEQAEATRRGSATVRGWVRDEQGAMRPVSAVRAGDTLIVSDRPDDPPRRVIATDYNHPSRTNTLTLDSVAASLNAILERLQGALTGAI